MADTIEELKTMREELVERRREEVFWISSAHDEKHIGLAAQLQLAIEAMDAVIAEAKEPEQKNWATDVPIKFV